MVSDGRASRRRELVAAHSGREETLSSPSGGADAAVLPDAYPLLTAVTPGGVPIVRRPRASARSSEVRVERLADGVDVLADRLESELADGGCVLVIRNTVGRVLETAHALRDRFGAGGRDRRPLVPRRPGPGGQGQGAAPPLRASGVHRAPNAGLLGSARGPSSGQVRLWAGYGLLRAPT